MTGHTLQDLILAALPKALILDLIDQVNAKALSAHQLVKPFGLDPKRERSLEGQARYRLVEKMFEEVCERFGGVPLANEIIPGTSFRVYQPFRRFEAPAGGVILGLAMMPTGNELPSKNMSRVAGVTLNYELTPRLDFDGKGAKWGDIFVLFLAARDRRQAGKIEEIAVGIIDSKYEGYVFYKTTEELMMSYSPQASEAGSEASEPLVTLKRGVKKFQPPETRLETPEEENDKK